jgi:hypothetical protein
MRTDQQATVRQAREPRSHRIGAALALQLCQEFPAVEQKKLARSRLPGQHQVGRGRWTVAQPQGVQYQLVLRSVICSVSRVMAAFVVDTSKDRRAGMRSVVYAKSTRQ